jgi:hypothetical protein
MIQTKSAQFADNKLFLMRKSTICAVTEVMAQAAPDTWRGVFHADDERRIAETRFFIGFGLRRDTISHGALMAQVGLRRHDGAPKENMLAHSLAPSSFSHGAPMAHGAPPTRWKQKKLGAAIRTTRISRPTAPSHTRARPDSTGEEQERSTA